MEGFGTYQYLSGAVYTGEWKNNRHHGKVCYLIREYSSLQMVLNMKEIGKIIALTEKEFTLTKMASDGKENL